MYLISVWYYMFVHWAPVVFDIKQNTCRATMRSITWHHIIVNSSTLWQTFATRTIIYFEFFCYLQCQYVCPPPFFSLQYNTQKEIVIKQKQKTPKNKKENKKHAAILTLNDFYRIHYCYVLFYPFRFTLSNVDNSRW